MYLESEDGVLARVLILVVMEDSLGQHKWNVGTFEIQKS